MLARRQPERHVGEQFLAAGVGVREARHGDMAHERNARSNRLAPLPAPQEGTRMSSLLDLTVQGDVATITDESKLPQVKLMTPLELYRLWERQGWASHEIDLTQDRRDWEAMPEEERDEMLWGLSAFFVGEERVTSQFSGLVLAADDKHEEAFLISQQVDEARHAQHFNRLYEEVFQYDGSFEHRLQRACQVLTAAYFQLFDGYLVES